MEKTQRARGLSFWFEVVGGFGLTAIDALRAGSRSFRTMVGRNSGEPVGHATLSASTVCEASADPLMTLAHRPMQAEAIELIETPAVETGDGGDGGDGVATSLEHRRRLMYAIQLHNPSASEQWLGAFSEHALELYLAHLESARRPRGGSSRWVRPGDTPAVQSWACNVA